MKSRKQPGGEAADLGGGPLLRGFETHAMLLLRESLKGKIWRHDKGVRSYRQMAADGLTHVKEFPVNFMGWVREREMITRP